MKPRNAYNRTKYEILKLLYDSDKDYTPREIADEIGIAHNAAQQRLRMLNLQGYVWRREEYRSGYTNQYCYRNLKKKGIRVFQRLRRRIMVELSSGMEVSLNLNKPEPKFTNTIWNTGFRSNIINQYGQA